jgi:hypothetical protein
MYSKGTMIGPLTTLSLTGVPSGSVNALKTSYFQGKGMQQDFLKCGQVASWLRVSNQKSHQKFHHLPLCPLFLIAVL